MHCLSTIALPLLFSTALAVPADYYKGNSASSSDAHSLGLIDQLELAPTAVDRLNLLPKDSDFVFDFKNPPSGSVVMGEGGHIAAANRKDFPALIGTGAAMAVGFLGPCGFNTPHTHPRSAELNIVVEGMLSTEFILENGARPVQTTNMTAFQMTVFPLGSIHAEFNPTCYNTTFVAGFASEDPGTQSTAQTFFGLKEDIVDATLGDRSNKDVVIDGADLDKFKTQIPAGIALGVEQCLQACKIPKNSY